jgi:hypothetical protein
MILAHLNIDQLLGYLDKRIEDLESLRAEDGQERDDVRAYKDVLNYIRQQH